MDNSRFFPAGDSCENSIRTPRDHLPSPCSFDRIRDRCQESFETNGIRGRSKKKRGKKKEKTRRGEMNCLARRRVYLTRVVARERAFPAADLLGAGPDRTRPEEINAIIGTGMKY